jgi:hypothetical protein
MIEHRYREKDMSQEERLIDGGMSCALCGQTRSEHEKEEKEEITLRQRLLCLKSMLEETEEKTRVCYLEVVELLVELDRGEYFEEVGE